MRPLTVTIGVAVAVAVAVGLIGRVLDLQGPLWLLALLAGMFLVSLVDRPRFYGGASLARRTPRRGAR